jgi:NAD(P)-dependent dehydrogenase (short-subunit alcohol dehydrogenase family)
MRGGGGIGRAAAPRFPSQGGHVVLVDVVAAGLQVGAVAVTRARGEVLAGEPGATRFANA